MQCGRNTCYVRHVIEQHKVVDTNERLIQMAARRNRKAAEIDVKLDDLEPNTDVIVEDVPEEPKRKYFSHANCDHARKGDVGKAARAQCRRNIRAWLAAEAEFLNENAEDVAV